MFLSSSEAVSPGIPQHLTRDKIRDTGTPPYRSEGEVSWQTIYHWKVMNIMSPFGSF